MSVNRFSLQVVINIRNNDNLFEAHILRYDKEYKEIV